MKKIIYTLFLIQIFITNITAQQTSQFTQAAEEFGLINPAGLTFEEMRLKGTVVNLNIRNQWWDTKVEGKPTTQVLSWLENKNELNHFGATLIADQIGETRDLGLSLRYAHKLAKGLKIGIGIGGLSHRISVADLDQFDENDPIAVSAGEMRWKLNASAGFFYHFSDFNRAFSWFVGGAFQRIFFTDDLSGMGNLQPETHLLAHGGLSWNKTWWLGGRLRFSVNLPDAIDLYLRKYFAEEKFFLGAIVTSDSKHQTVGGQVGYEWLFKSGTLGSGHHVITSVGFSKPLSKYVDGSNLIFDARVTWAWDRKGMF